jgi:hypothetical protein
VDGFENDVTPDGRLPDAAQGQDHIRKIFYRMGFDVLSLCGFIHDSENGNLSADSMIRKLLPFPALTLSDGATPTGRSDWQLLSL